MLGNLLNRISSMASSSSPSAAQTTIMLARETVESTIQAHHIAVFSKTYCGFCRRTKKLLQEKYPDADVSVIELDKRDDGGALQRYLEEKTGQWTVPNIFINKSHVGGNDELQAAYRAGALTKMINGA
ncbi:thioredoxin-like protein [Mycena floridula]|nr:thioredoxin-like protein [Mycena floridula]